MRFFILLLFIFSWLLSSGQLSPEKLVAIQERSKWVKAEKLIRKAQTKDSLNPEPAYLLSLFYFQVRHTTYNLDSANLYQRRTARLLEGRDRGRKAVPDSLDLKRLRSQIDSTAFEQAKATDSELGYQFFIDHYRSAIQIPAATELRDEVAFMHALKENTYKSFFSFIERYPTSHRQTEAQGRMDKLQYEEETKDKRLSSYIRFYTTYSESPFRSEAERNMFEMATAPGVSEVFYSFMKRFPESQWSERARSMLFELRQVNGEGKTDASWMTDSLRRIEKLNAVYWVPIIKSGRYGFMDEKGKETVSPRFESIPEEYRCGEIANRFLITAKGLLARNGTIFWPGRIKDSKELGLGFVLVSSDSGRMVIHSSGFRVGPPDIQDALVVSNRFLGVKKKGKWSVLSLIGKMLLPFQYDEVMALDSLIQLTKNGKRILTTPGRIAAVAGGKEFREDFVFDDTRKWGDQQYWVRNSLLEGVIDANLKFLIPLDRQTLRKTSFGFVASKSDRIFIKGIKSLENIPYKTVTEQAGWVRMQDLSNRHFLFDKGFGWKKEGDSVWFQGQLAFLQAKDSVTAFLPSGNKISFPESAAFQFKAYLDSAAWMVLDDKKKKVVYDAESGSKLFTTEFDQIDPVSRSFFILTRLDKKGLVKADGKVLLPTEYDAIVLSDVYMFSLLKDKKFGWYDARTGLLVKPMYDRNVRPYSLKLRLAYKAGGYGFIHPDGTALGGNEWEEIQYWNDSVAWVKKGGFWKLLEIQTQKVKLDKIRKFSYLKDLPSEKIALIQQERAYGVISNFRGVVVPIEYTDIVNLGTNDAPLYFTERHISEAGISVVVYYDQHGRIIRKQAMEADEFERISCDN